MLIGDITGSGSIFDVRNRCQNILSLSVEKNISISKEIDEKNLHDIFTYYFYKIIDECPNITSENLVKKMEESIERFNEIFICEVTSRDLSVKPIFF